MQACDKGMTADLARWARATRPGGFTLRDVQREAPTRPLRREAAAVIEAAEKAGLILRLAPGSIVAGAKRKVAWRPCDTAEPAAPKYANAPCDIKKPAPCDTEARQERATSPAAPREKKRATQSRAEACGKSLHPDAAALLRLIEERGPTTYGAASSDLGWGATRAWRAEGRLSCAGLIHYPERDGRMRAKH